MTGILTNVDIYTLLRANVQYVLINDVNFNETNAHDTLLGIYSLNVIKLSKNIYIEVILDRRRTSNNY